MMKCVPESIYNALKAHNINWALIWYEVDSGEMHIEKVQAYVTSRSGTDVRKTSVDLTMPDGQFDPNCDATTIKTWLEDLTLQLLPHFLPYFDEDGEGHGSFNIYVDKEEAVIIHTAHEWQYIKIANCR